MKKQTYLKLRGLLAENDMTIAELAYQTGKSTPHISQCLLGKAQWRLDVVYRILDYFGIPYDQMHIYFPKRGAA